MPDQLVRHFSNEKEYNKTYKGEINWAKGAEHV
jgi:hypothetical protein